jgi:hypothetical protein
VNLWSEELGDQSERQGPRYLADLWNERQSGVLMHQMSLLCGGIELQRVG